MREIVAGAVCTLFLSNALAAPAPDASSERMDQIVQYYVEKQLFAGAVLVARGDTVLFSKGYGSANLEWNMPNTPSTKFRIASLTKQFTAAAVLLLEEKGKLKVEDLVKKHYPDAPAAWDNITLFQLLTHTSGIPDLNSDPGFSDFFLKRRTPDKVVRFFRDQPLDFEPGTQFRYSNSGYALLGLIIEKASGMSYGKFLDENIFKPLGMKDSGFDDNEKAIPHRASGYGIRAGEILNVPCIDISVFYSFGGLYSTVEDLLRWERGLFQGRLLSAGSLEKMTTPAKNGYAFGLYVGEKFGARIMEHTGSMWGFASRLAYYPEDAITVVALSNISRPGASPIVEQLGALVHGEEVVLPPARVEPTTPQKSLQ
jgi:CubicO group peptidase (beta-lactamase class C family)